MLGKFANLCFVQVHNWRYVCGYVSPLGEVSHHSFGLVTASTNNFVQLVCVIVNVNHSGSGFYVALAESVGWVKNWY